MVVVDRIIIIDLLMKIEAKIIMAVLTILQEVEITDLGVITITLIQVIENLKNTILQGITLILEDGHLEEKEETK